MFTAQGGELPSAGVILDDEPGTDQERFDHLRHRAGRQAKHRGENIQPRNAIRQGTKIFLLGRAAAGERDLERLKASAFDLMLADADRLPERAA